MSEKAASRVATALLVLLLAAATALRVLGLSSGLRHPPHGDESAFVDNVHRMLAEGSFDHRYYEYPGLFFYALAPVLAAVMGSEPPTPTAYLAARGVVAAFGVLAVALQYAWSRRLVGRGPALLAAALAAVSPVAVHTAHSIRPDVALLAVFLLALLLGQRMDGSPRRDLLAGAALGAAGAVKFSGIFLVPALLAQRLLAGPRRVRGVALLGLGALVTFVLASPFSVLHFGEFVEGVETQLSYHYEENPERTTSYGGMVLVYLAVWWKALGTPAALLSLAGLVAALRAPRRYGPALLVPVTAIAVLATSHVRHDRFLLPALAVAFMLAGLGLTLVPDRRFLRPAAALLVVAPPLLASMAYLRDVTRPGTGDRAIDWANARLPPGSRVLTRVDLGLDESRLEVFRVRRLDRRQLVLADYVVATHRDEPEAVAGLVPLETFAPSGRYNGPTVTVFEVPPAQRPPVTPMTLAGASVHVTSNPAEASAMVDGRPETLWRTAEIQRAGDAVTVELPQETVVARAELLLGDTARFAAREAQLQVRAPDGTWRGAITIDGRGRPQTQHAPMSQVLILDQPASATALRLVLVRNAGRRWGIAELRVFALTALVAPPAP